jgi:hypothetical protein
MPTELPYPDRRQPAALVADLIAVLESAEKPVSLGELSQRLGRPFRAVAVTLAAASRLGGIDCLEGGLYVRRLPPALSDLFAFVRECEVAWETDDRRRIFARVARNR